MYFRSEVDLVSGQRSRRLVHDEELCVGVKRTADRDKLALGNRQLSDLCIQLDVDPELVECGLRIPPDRLPSNRMKPSAMLADRDILRNSEIREKRQILVDHLNAECHALQNTEVFERSTPDHYRSA